MNYSNLDKSKLIELLNKKDATINKLKKENKKLKYYATVDDMTGVLNRRVGFNLLKKHMVLSKIYKTNVMICIIDIDNFKYINDTYGHLEGDNVLKRVSNVICESIRCEDSIFRFGGDEFVIIFPNMSKNQIDKIANRIYLKLDEYNRHMPYNITLSYGVSEYTYRDKLSIEQLLTNADKKMYEEKRDK